MAKFSYIPNRVIDTNGISDGANIYFYTPGTTTPVTIYSDAGFTTPVSNPYPVSSGAAVPALYHNESGGVRVKVVDSSGNTVSDDDPWSAFAADVVSTATGDDLQDALNGYATRPALKAITSYAGARARLTESGRGGEFVFRSGDYSTEVTADAQEGLYIKADDTAATSGAWVREFDGFVNAKWFGATGDGSTDDTAALQAAVDFVLNNAIDTLYIPSGKYVFSSLDCTDSGGTDRAGRGKFKIIGDGQLAIGDAFGAQSNEYGTILSSSATTANAVVVSNNATSTRFVRLENLSVVYGGTGYAIQAEYCPEFTMKEVSVRVTSTGGRALYLSDAWTTKIERSFFICDTAVTSTVAGVTFDATIFAGNVMFRDCIFQNFNDCVYQAPSTKFANVIYENCAMQQFGRYGLFCEGPVANIALRDCYMETDGGTNCIKIAATSGSVDNFSVDGLYLRGGTTTAGDITGAAIDLDVVGAYRLNKVYYFRPWTALVNHGSSVGSGKIDTLTVVHDGVANLPTGPLYLITGTMAADGDTTVSNRYIEVTPKIELFDSSSHRIGRDDGLGVVANTLSLGTLDVQSLSVATYKLSLANPRATTVLANVSGASPSALWLPNISNIDDTNMRIIVSDPASTQGLILRDHGGSAIGHTVAAGDAAICIADQANSKWMVLPISTVAYGP